MKNYKKALR